MVRIQLSRFWPCYRPAVPGIGGGAIVVCHPRMSVRPPPVSCSVVRRHRPPAHGRPPSSGGRFPVSCTGVPRRYAPSVTRMGTRKKRRRKSCHSIYEREELASYIPIAKPFLRSHSSAFGGVQLSASRPAVLRQGAVPVRCRSGEVPFR